MSHMRIRTPLLSLATALACGIIATPAAGAFELQVEGQQCHLTATAEDVADV